MAAKYSDSSDDSDLNDDGDSETGHISSLSGSEYKNSIDAPAYQNLGVRPYQFEPQATEGDRNESSDPGPETPMNRQLDTSWCRCGNCIIHECPEENRCCREIMKMNDKMAEYKSHHSHLECITEHPGFSSVCLNVWVLQTAYFQYKQQYNERRRQISMEERYRYVAYRQLVRWCWEYLGKKVRVPLPSCAYALIRQTFPSEEFTGFKYPNLDN